MLLIRGRGRLVAQAVPVAPVAVVASVAPVPRRHASVLPRAETELTAVAERDRLLARHLVVKPSRSEAPASGSAPHFDDLTQRCAT